MQTTKAKQKKKARKAIAKTAINLQQKRGIYKKKS
jgi:hypothetical protein